jgi:hypothetical protein
MRGLRFRTGATVDLDVGALPPSDGVLPGTHDAIYRVAQEALANVARHARAKHVQVSLTRQRSRTRLRVADDGVGFDVSASTAGMGRRNMRARAADIGGDLRMTSAPGAGTEVVFEVPIQSNRATAEWRLAAFAGLLSIGALVTRLVEGQWDRAVVLFGLAVFLLVSALISSLRSWRKAPRGEADLRRDCRRPPRGVARSESLSPVLFRSDGRRYGVERRRAARAPV